MPTPQPGDLMKLDGGMYVVAEIDASRGPGREVVRLAKREGSSEKYRIAMCALAEVVDSGEGWWYLPLRVNDYLLPRLGMATAAGTITGAEARALNASITSHPAYLAGRDDVAEEQVCGQRGVTLPQQTPPEHARAASSMPREG